MALIGMLLLACIAGSMIASDRLLGVNNARAYVFNTSWFIGLMALLGLNVILCTWTQLAATFALFRKKEYHTDRDYFARNGDNQLPWTRTPEQLCGILSRLYTSVYQQGNAFYARRGYLGRMGFVMVHAGLLWTLIASGLRIVAEDFGWGIYGATITVPEGGTAKSYNTRKNRLMPLTEQNIVSRPLPFVINLISFRAEYYPNSTIPHDFTSLIELRDGSVKKEYRVSMNTPLTYKGYRITQNSYDETPGGTGGTTRYTAVYGLQKDPATVWMFAGAIIMMAGALLAFMINYREAWLWHDEQSGVIYAATHNRGADDQARADTEKLLGIIGKQAA